MIVLYTDFGSGSFYAGQMELVCRGLAPAVPCVTLTHDAPCCAPRAASRLLAALLHGVPRQAMVLLAVVDPGVGGARRAVAARSGDRWLVGPDNGLLAEAAGADADWFRIDWMPERLSDTFHGRDLFAPVAARLALGERVAMTPITDPVGRDWLGQPLAEVIAIDRFGNLITGLTGDALLERSRLRLAGVEIGHARCFSAVAAGELFWYRNSIGLVEIAAGGTSAAERLQVGCGASVQWEETK